MRLLLWPLGNHLFSIRLEYIISTFTGSCAFYWYLICQIWSAGSGDCQLQTNRQTARQTDYAKLFIDVCYVSSFILFSLISFVCGTPRYLYKLSVSMSVFLSVLVEVHSAGSNFPLCTMTFTRLLIQYFIPMTLLKMKIVLTNALHPFSVFAYSLRSSIYSK